MDKKTKCYPAIFLEGWIPKNGKNGYLALKRLLSLEGRIMVKTSKLEIVSAEPKTLIPLLNCISLHWGGLLLFVCLSLLAAARLLPFLCLLLSVSFAAAQVTGWGRDCCPSVTCILPLCQLFCKIPSVSKEGKGIAGI